MSILCVDGERVETDRPLEIGDVVKVHLSVANGGSIETEAPWAEVVELLSDDSWRGRISNYLMYEHGFDYGDVVTFERTDDGERWWWECVEQRVRVPS